MGTHPNFFLAPMSVEGKTVLRHRPSSPTDPTPPMEGGGAHISKVDRVFFQPHTVSGLIVVLASVAYVGFHSDAYGLSSSKLGLVASAFVFLVFAMLNLGDGPFIRPHPAVWRVVLGLSVLYVVCLTYLLFQSKDDARALMGALDPALGVPLPERSYGDDCSLYTPDHPSGSSFANLMDALFDEFVIAHALGWVAKMVMLRDVTLCVVLSLLFEVLEYTFEHMLPNLGECWWDHFILDVLVCNLLGMVVGYWMVHFLEMKTYNWVGLSDIPSVKRFLYVLAVIVFIEINELCAFFLKTLLWVPPPHPINPIRLPALREYYEFVTNPHVHRFGAQLWIAVIGIALELLLVIKFGQGEFSSPPPSYIVYGWSTFGVLLLSFIIYRFVLYPPSKSKKS